MALGNTWTNIASRSVYVAPATITFYIDAKLNRQDISGNYSVVDTRLTSTISGGAAGSGYRFTLTGSNGISGDAVWTFANETILTGQTTIYHNDDGTKVGSASAYCYNRYLGISVDFSGSFTLPTIARASEPTISPSSTFNIGSTITINTNRKSNTFTHTLSLSFGSYTYQIGTNVGASATLNTSTIANSLYQQIPNANSGTGTITCITYNGSTQVGTKSVSFTAKVVNSNPTFNQAYLDTNSTTTTITQNNQQIIRNKSTLQINITSASAKNYSTLSSSKVVINGITYNGTFSGSSSTINVGTINVSSNTTAKVSVTDSRGNTTTKDLAITILDWKQPSAIINLERESNYYSTTNINVNAEYSSLSNKNTISIKVREKKTTESTWGAYTTLQDEVTAQLTLDNEYAWNVQVVVEDKLATTTYNLVLDRGIPIVYFDRQRRSVGINKFPQHDSSLEVDGSTYVGNIYTKNLLDTYSMYGGYYTATAIANSTNVNITSASNGSISFKINGTWLGVASDYMEVKPSTWYTISLTANRSTSDTWIAMYYYDSSMNFISMSYVRNYFYYSTIAPSNAKYLKILIENVSSTTDTITYSNMQVEEGSTATSYAPYQKLNGYDNYSTNEIRIGTWSNGKPLYRKVIETTLPNGTIDISINSNIQVVWLENGYFNAPSGNTNRYFTIPFISNDAKRVLGWGLSTGYFHLVNEISAYNGYNCYLSIIYTKTTD